MGYKDAHYEKLIMACGLSKSSKCNLPLGLLDSQGSIYVVFQLKTTTKSASYCVRVL